MFSMKPDYEQVKRRYDAFWECQLIDRPPVSIAMRSEARKPVPAARSYASERERWLDVEYRAEQTAAHMANVDYLYDSLPIAWPNMGPEIFSAWCGCGYEFGESTTWSEPCVSDWAADWPKARLNREHPLLLAVIKYTRALLELGRGKFIVGLTDFHAGGDHLAALRDPANLALDMIENLDYVKKALVVANEEYFDIYNYFYEMLRAEHMPITSWTPLIDDGRYYIPSNDFSCMISKKMFDETFLPGIIEECKFYSRSIYHLDGPGALQHLDSLLDIPELDAVQWVCGSGNEGYARWVKVYQRIQKAGKALQLGCSIEELPLVFETLKPEGVWFAGISGIDSRETAERVVKRIEKWA